MSDDPKVLTFEETLADLFRAQGVVDAKGAAKRAMKDIELCRRHQEVYELRATLTVEQVSKRTGYSKQRIKQIQKDQIEILRAG